jgi:TetR/AcrR family transcriptional regulator, transcriptional repressor for nem operon
MTRAPTVTTASILDAAQRMTQAVGYNGVSFRDLAAAVGIKSASVHYHFPTKGQLGAAVARRYTDKLLAHLDEIDAGSPDPKAAMAAYVASIRATLAQDGRMCLCGMLAAETDAIPEEVRVEVRRFVDLNIRWLAGVLERATGASAASPDVWEQARAIFAALEGAMLVARGMSDPDSFDAMAAQLGRTGLIPQ